MGHQSYADRIQTDLEYEWQSFGFKQQWFVVGFELINYEITHDWAICNLFDGREGETEKKLEEIMQIQRKCNLQLTKLWVWLKCKARDKNSTGWNGLRGTKLRCLEFESNTYSMKRFLRIFALRCRRWMEAILCKVIVFKQTQLKI